MPRFFLRFHDGDTVHPDDDGAEFTDAASARSEAVRSGREILAEGIFTSEAKHMRYDIVDAHGAVLDTVQLADLR